MEDRNFGEVMKSYYCGVVDIEKGRVVRWECELCGLKRKTEDAIYKHIYTQHKDKIKEEDKGFFPFQA